MKLAILDGIRMQDTSPKDQTAESYLEAAE
jgi:hypothetical protein